MICCDHSRASSTFCSRAKHWAHVHKRPGIHKIDQAAEQMLIKAYQNCLQFYGPFPHMMWCFVFFLFVFFFPNTNQTSLTKQSSILSRTSRGKWASGQRWGLRHPTTIVTTAFSKASSRDASVRSIIVFLHHTCFSRAGKCNLHTEQLTFNSLLSQQSCFFP